MASSAITSYVKAGAITDDGEFIAFGSWTGEKVDIYKWSDYFGRYISNQEITLDSGVQVQCIALTPDHSFLVVGSYGSKVIVYKHSGTQFL